jgi:3-oxoacyl-[acyl-carrier protein] reductase
MLLNGKVALVTGARGIGGACASLLAERGADVIVVYKQNQEAADQLVSTIAKNGGKAQAYQTDVLDTVQITHLVDRIRQRYNRLDILVSNAAVGWLEKPFEQLVWQEVEQEINHELKAAFELTKAVLPLMVEQQSGHLIYMASSLASHVLADTLASSMAKAALLAFMRNIAFEYGPQGITANAVAPAMVSTEVNQYMPQAVLDAIKAYTPLRRIATPEEVAGVVAFLASGDSAFMTGTCLTVDGGKILAA